MGSIFSRVAGSLLLLGSAQVILAIIIAESLYPGYSVHQALSDLGVGSTAVIFNTSVIILGLTYVLAAYSMLDTIKSKPFLAALAVSGLAVIGVGLFPENTGLPHAIFALITFLVGAATVLLSSRVVKGLLSYMFIVLGAVSFAAIILGISAHYLGLGFGGMERIATYPIFIWSIAFGSYILSSASAQSQ